MNRARFPAAILLLGLAAAIVSAQAPSAGGEKSPLSDPKSFPVAVWLQDPANAPKYKDLGINVYVGLWRGPTEKQLAELKKHGLRVICSQNAIGLQHKD